MKIYSHHAPINSSQKSPFQPFAACENTQMPIKKQADHFQIMDIIITMSCLRLPSYSHHKTLEPLKNKASEVEWGSRGRKFESSHPDVPEALKNKGFRVFLCRIINNANRHK